MIKQSNVETLQPDAVHSAGEVFDRSILAHHTMNDPALAGEIMKLFLAQLRQLENLDWADLDLSFEMHRLRGAAAAVGAIQLQNLAENWRDRKPQLKAEIVAAIMAFRQKAQA